MRKIGKLPAPSAITNWAESNRAAVVLPFTTNVKCPSHSRRLFARPLFELHARSISLEVPCAQQFECRNLREIKRVFHLDTARSGL